jgi:hypothetical protein
MNEYVVVQYARTAPPVQVEVHDSKMARSCEGALHFAPGATKELTKSEHEYLRSKGVFKALLVVARLEHDSEGDSDESDSTGPNQE